MEQRWVAEQKKLKLKHLKEKIEKGKKKNQYVQKFFNCVKNFCTYWAWKKFKI